MDINRMRNYTKQKLMVGTLCAVMSMPATADDIVSIPGTLSAAVPWNIIGEYTAGSIRTEKWCVVVKRNLTLIPGYRMVSSYMLGVCGGCHRTIPSILSLV